VRLMCTLCDDATINVLKHSALELHADEMSNLRYLRLHNEKHLE
jgi:hypothetical protein